MKYYIDPGRERRSVNFHDNIVYSKVSDMQGRPLELKLSLMAQSGNVELRMATGKRDASDRVRPKAPCIVWVPGGGWRGCDKNLMTCEMEFLAEAGYVVASIYYRSVEEGHFPAQIIDVKSAVRFLRANAVRFGIDPERIGIIGRSAGGHLATLAAMNLDGFDVGENLEYSSKVQACVDMFGPANMEWHFERTARMIADGSNSRWKSVGDSHEGKLLGIGSAAENPELVRAASPYFQVNEAMCPVCILHGDSDSSIPCEFSEGFYEHICQLGFGDRVDMYVLKNAGHGSPEFFQESTKQLMLDFYAKTLKA